MYNIHLPILSFLDASASHSIGSVPEEATEESMLNNMKLLLLLPISIDPEEEFV